MAAVSLTRNSSAELQEILCLGDPEVASSLGLARVTNTAPASTNAGLNVRILSGPSSLADFAVRAVLPSTAGDNPVSAAQASTVWAVQVDGRVRAQNSTIGDLLASVQQNSTVWAVQVDGRVRAQNSTIGDLLASVQQNSTVWAVQVDGRVRAQNSTQADFIGQFAPISSSGVSMSTDADPASTKQGLIVRQVGYSTQVTVANFSTTVNVSSLAGPVIVRSSAADALGTIYQSTFADLRATVHNSTIGDLLASVQQNSTVWQVQAKIQDSSAVSPNIVGTRPTTGAQGIAVRTILNDLQSTCFSTIGNNSTSATVVSSAASVRHKVYAYSITSTAQAVNTLSFASSLANAIWQVQMQSVSSGITGANLAVSPPAWLFATESASPLVFKITGTTGSYHLSFSYFTEA